MRVFESESGTLVVRLDVDEEIVASLTTVVKERGLKGGAITGIGAVKNTTLGYFDVHTKTYDRRVFADDFELVGLTGNITWVDSEPMIHLHAVLGGPDYAAVAGHLFSSEISITGEITITPNELALQRGLDERTGLKLIQGSG